MLNPNELPSAYKGTYDIFNEFDDIVFDLSNLTKEEIDQQYYHFLINKRFATYTESILFENQYGEYINKNRNITVDVDTVKHDISFIFDLTDWQFKVEKHCNDVECAFIIPNIDTNIDVLTKSMEQLGWYRSRCAEYDIYDRHYVNVKFEPLYAIDITKDIRANVQYLYHISPACNHMSIKWHGFIPKSNNKLFDYPDRVYFIKDPIDNEYLKDVCIALYENSDHKYTKYNIYTLDVSKISIIVKFQDDPNLEHGIFTYNKVSYKSVINVNTIKL